MPPLQLDPAAGSGRKNLYISNSPNSLFFVIFSFYYQQNILVFYG